MKNLPHDLLMAIEDLKLKFEQKGLRIKKIDWEEKDDPDFFDKLLEKYRSEYQTF